MTQRTVADFLTTDGFCRPGVAAVLREGSIVREVGRYAVRSMGASGARRLTPYASRPHSRGGDPVVLVPGFLAGDGSLLLMSRALRQKGLRTYRSDIRANVGCTLAAATQLEHRLEEIALRRGIVDWRACIDPVAVPVEVRCSHVGMAFDPHVISAVVQALRPQVHTC